MANWIPSFIYVLLRFIYLHATVILQCDIAPHHLLINAVFLKVLDISKAKCFTHSANMRLLPVAKTIFSCLINLLDSQKLAP